MNGDHVDGGLGEDVPRALLEELSQIGSEGLHEDLSRVIALDVRNHFREPHQTLSLDATLYLLLQFIEFLEDGYLFQVALQVFVLVDLKHELSTWILSLLNVEDASLS